MVKFFSQEEADESSRWQQVLSKAEQVYDDIWAGGEKLPDRDEE